MEELALLSRIGSLDRNTIRSLTTIVEAVAATQEVCGEETALALVERIEQLLRGELSLQ